MALEWKRGTFVYDVVGLGHTSTTALNAFQSFLTQCGWDLAAYSTSTDKYFVRTDRATNDYWRFNGDGPNQNCGILVRYNAGNSRLEIAAFLENQAGNASQKISNSTHIAHVTLDGTAPNNWLFVGGEGGFYVEAGRDGLPTNLGHAMVVAWEVIPEFNGTDDARRMWTTQGAVCDLFGNLKFTADRNSRFVDNQGTNKNYTGRLRPYVCRGTGNFNLSSQGDDRQIGIGPRDNFFSFARAASSSSLYNEIVRFCFGLINTPRDGRYRISPMLVDQLVDNAHINCGTTTSSASNNVAPDGSAYLFDLRQIRRVAKFAVVDASLIPFVTITDLATNVIYRVAQVGDGGRACNIGIVWPDNSNVVTVTG